LTSVLFSDMTATPQLSTLSLHDALPIFRERRRPHLQTPRILLAGRHQVVPALAEGVLGAEVDAAFRRLDRLRHLAGNDRAGGDRSEEHTSELQSRVDLVCRLLLEKKKKI